MLAVGEPPAVAAAAVAAAAAAAAAAAYAAAAADGCADQLPPLLATAADRSRCACNWACRCGSPPSAAVAAAAPLAADRWPYDPLLVLVRDAANAARPPPTLLAAAAAAAALAPLTRAVASELGENRIIALMSNESEYGDADMARLRLIDARIEPPTLLAPPPPRPRDELSARDASRLKWKSVLASELAAAAVAAAWCSELR